MATLDVFASDAFSMASLTNSVNKLEYVPGRIGAIGLFTPKPVSTVSVWVEERGDSLVLVPNMPRGGSPSALDNTARKRVGRNFTIPHLVRQDTIHADEIQGVRAFGSETELQVLQQIVNDRTGVLRRHIEFTWENLFLGAIKGTITDADSTTIYNLFTEFGVSQEAEVDFDLDAASPASGVLRKKVTQTKRTLLKNLKGAPAGVQVFALCGDAFWDDLIAHVEVQNTYKNTAEASVLRSNAAWEEFDFGGVHWINYRGSDDGTMGVNTDKCHLFPVGVPGLFDLYFAPADTMEFVNTRGLPFYAMQAPDKEFGRYVRIEVQSNPLPICTQPKVLVQGKRT